MLKWTGALAAGAVGLVAGVGLDMGILRPTVTPPGTTTTTTVTETATGAGPTALVEDFVYTACQGGGCHGLCTLKTIIADGKIIRTEQMGTLPEPEGDRSGICQKGIMAYRLVNNPNRILYPMKRVGKRGEGKFERITWQQAIDEIGVKLREVIDKYGPEAVGFFTICCGGAPVSGLFGVIGSRYMNLLGGSSIGASNSVDVGECYSTLIDFGAPHIWSPTHPTFGYDPSFLLQSNYIVSWMSNPMSTRPVGVSRYMLQAREKGAKLVQVGLWYDQTAAKADWFIPVRGGSDAALALAMAHVIVEENLVDWDFMTKHTVAPFLVRSDNGLFLRESDVVNGGDAKKYVWWDAVSKSAKSIAGHVLEFPQGTLPDLLAAPTVKGIACKAAFLKLKEQLAEYTPESQEKITGVKASTCREFAREYVQNRPSTIWHMWGARYQGSGRSCRALVLLSALSGNLGLRGGRIANPSYGSYGTWPFYWLADNIMYPEGAPGAKWPLWRDVLSGARTGQPFPMKATISGWTNFVHALPSRQDWEELLDGTDLNVNIEIRMTDTSMWADYILPDAMCFEKYDLIMYPQANQITLQEPAVQPHGECKTTAEIYRLLAKEVGLEKYFEKNDEEWVGEWLDEIQKDPAVAGITLERLKKEKTIRTNVPRRIPDPYEEGGLYPYTQMAQWYDVDIVTRPMDFPSKSGRVEFYYEGYADVGEAMARHVEPFMLGPKADRTKYPLQYVSARHRFFMQTQFTDDPVLLELSGKEPLLCINPKDAAARGIKEGDVCEVFNDRGSATAKAHLTEIFPPGVVNLWFGYRKHQHIAGSQGYLQRPHAVEESDDNLTKRAGWEWDMLWDNFAEVRKV